ncbi:MAG: thioredoxin-disulfide reductase [Clostridia bacterium]|nr:thioredoxin-disulfide reductase [Clostridia bacterium]
MEKIYDIVIIGGGPAGYTAALYGARAGHSTLLIEKMTIGGQMTETGDIDNYPGFQNGIDGITLGINMQAGAERYGAETMYEEVTAVDLTADPKRITTAFSGDILARSVIISTGAGPRRLGLPGEDSFVGQGIHYCAHCDGRFYKGRRVIVVGGGNTAVGDALYLSNLCEKVYVIHRRDSFRASKVLADSLLRAENVEVIWNSRAKSLKVDDGLGGLIIEDVKNGEETELLADAVFVSIGRVPATSLFEKSLLLEGGYIAAGEDTKTSLPGVFAAGDVRTKELRQVITAAADGAVAAHLAGEYLAEKN